MLAVLRPQNRLDNALLPGKSDVGMRQWPAVPIEYHAQIGAVE